MDKQHFISKPPSFASKPTSVRQRLDSLDVLRGFAVLAIFAVNVKMMANGYNHYVDPSMWTGKAAPAISFFHFKFIHGKFVTIFTALFGAGLVLLLNRDKPVPTKIVLRRLAWLAVFGALHMIFLREGDILLWYALAGFVAMLFAKLRARWLFLAGAIFQAIAFVRSYYLTAPERSIPILWQTDPASHEGAAAIMLGPVSGHIVARIDTIRYYLLDLYISGGVWAETLGIMLLGMALLKIGFLSGQMRARTYALWATVGLVCGTILYLLRPFADADNLFQSFFLNATLHIHVLGGAIAWSALIIWLVVIGWQGRPLAAVGRTAFTVYILQSVIGLLLFSSIGFGLFGQLSLLHLMGITVAVWIIFLIAAPLWLTHFRFGPLEWIWRSLTYGKVQSLRR